VRIVGRAAKPMTYTPRPLDTSAAAAVLPAELIPLRERIAEHVHDVWAAGRIAHGWRYGEVRDDEAKTHPCLVPYGELPEAEKEYDRRTAEETLAAIVTLGFRIVRGGQDEAPPV
jgi:hypothetical protein